MKTFRNNFPMLTLATLCVFAVTSCSQKTSRQKLDSSGPHSQHKSAEILVQLNDPSVIELWKTQYGDLEVAVVESNRHIYQIRSQAFAGNEVQSAAEFERNPGVILAEVNHIWRTSDIVARDPHWLNLWGLKNYGQDAPGGSEGVADSDIGATLAWQKSKGSKDVIVAVIDTGIDYSHPDLAANMWVNEKEKHGLPGVDDDGNGWTDDIHGWNFVSFGDRAPYYGQVGRPDPMDDHGHGTHCAGTIGAVGNNFTGITGVNWSVSLMALKFLDANGSGDSADLYRALRYASANNVDVISASFGGGAPSKLIAAMIQELQVKGTLFVAAAGNSASDNDFEPHFPSNYEVDAIVSVAATDNRDRLASFSCYGQDTVDVAAPGVGIMSTYPVALAKKDGLAEPYMAMSGTSMATPHVAGAAALILAVKPELRKKPLELKQELLKGKWMPHLSGKMVSGSRLDLGIALGLRTSAEAIPMPPNEANGWITEALSLETPRNPTGLINDFWTVKKDGARAMQLRVRTASIDALDSLTLFDSLYRKMGAVFGMTAAQWTPVVTGDQVFVKFSNALVAVRKYLGSVIVADPAELKLQDGQTSTCFARDDGKLECHIMDKASDPFPNFISEGAVFDQIRYLPGVR